MALRPPYTDRSERYCLRQRPYCVEYTRSHPNSEVKQRKARSVLGWGTAWEVLRVLLAFCFCCLPRGRTSSRAGGSTSQAVLGADPAPLRQQLKKRCVPTAPLGQAHITRRGKTEKSVFSLRCSAVLRKMNFEFSSVWSRIGCPAKSFEGSR